MPRRRRLATPRAAGPLPRRDRRARPRPRPAVDGRRRPARGGHDHPDDGRLGLDEGDRRRPTRLAAAQKAASDFVDQLPGRFKVGLVAFSTAPRVVQSPDDRPGRHPPGDRTTCRPTAGPPWATRSRRRSRRPASAPDRALGDPSSRRVDAGATRQASPAPSGSSTPTAAPSRRSSRPCCCPTARTRPASSSPTRPPQQAAAAGVPVYTIALGTADGVVEVPDDHGHAPHPQRPTGHRDAGGDRRDDRRPVLRGTDRAGPRPDLPEPRLADRLHERGAGGHPVVRRGGPAARRRRRRPRRPLVQPLPMIDVGTSSPHRGAATRSRGSGSVGARLLRLTGRLVVRTARLHLR